MTRVENNRQDHGQRMVTGVDLASIRAAAGRISEHVTETPVLTSAALDALAGAHVFAKAECLQRSGSFKLRGAFNRLLTLNASAREHGVIAYSSGNHGAAVSLACAELGIPATVVVPSTVSSAKLEAIRVSNADLIFHDPVLENRGDIAQRVAAERNLTLVAPYDDYRVIAGQGTLALELFATVGQLDILIVPVSGGGLIAGVGVAAKALSPGIRIVGVEPVDADDTRRSLAAGFRNPLTDASLTIADGLRAQIPGELTFPINQELLSEIVTVTDRQIIEAMRACESFLGVRVEPSGAAAVAALLDGRRRDWGLTSDTRIGVVLSGGSIDAKTYEDLTRATAYG